MTRMEELTTVAAKILSRYPSSPRDEILLVTWAEELARRFPTAKCSTIEDAAVRCCRSKGGPFCPSLDEVCNYVSARLGREKPREIEAPVDEKTAAENLRRIREITGGVAARKGMR